MLEWTVILFLIALRVYQERTRPANRIVARRIFEKRSEEKLFPGMVIEGNPRFAHFYRQTSHGVKHSTSIQGLNMRPSLRRKVIGKLKRNKKTIAMVVINIMVIGILTQAGFLVPMTVLFAVRTWNAPGPGPGIWSDGGNWLPICPIGGPSDNDDAVFNATSTVACTMDMPMTNNLGSFLMDNGYTGLVSLGANALIIQSRVDTSTFTGTDGTFDCQTGVVIFSGSWDTSSAKFTFVRGTGLVDATGTGTVNTRDITNNAFYHFSCATGGKTTTLSSNIGTYGTLTVGPLPGALTMSTLQIAYLRSATTPLINNGTISCRITYYQDANVEVLSTTYGNRLDIVLGHGYTATLGGDIAVGEMFQVYVKTSTGLCTLDTANHNITVALSILIGASSDLYGVVVCGSSTIEQTGASPSTLTIINSDSYIVGNTSAWLIAGDLVNASTSLNWNPGTCTFTFNGGAQDIDMNGKALYNVVVAGTGDKAFVAVITTHDVRATVSRQITITAPLAWSVTSGGRIYADVGYTLTLRSSVGDTDWYMMGTNVTATRVDVKDSDARGGDTIDATDGTNTDSGNNQNWDFGETPPQMVGHNMIKGINDEVVSHSQLFGVSG